MQPYIMRDVAGISRPKLAENIDLTVYSEFESFYGHILDKYGDTTDHHAQTLALEELGVKTHFSYTLNIEDIIKSINKSYPVVLGVAYKSSGHSSCYWIRPR